MMRTRLFLAAGLMLGGAAPLLAQNAGPADLKVTVYNDDMALVSDTRQVSIPAGRSRQEFPDVSARIRPETVSLAGAGVGVVEQNFDFDLLSPAKLMEKAVGREVQLVRTNPATGAETRETATILAVNNGVVMRVGNRIEVLRDDQLPVRVVFDSIPENLRARPTLSVTVQSERAGPRPVTLSYLTPGMSWRADYVALFDERAGRMDVQGWVTLQNRTGTTFSNADTLLVAGSVRTEADRYDDNGGYYRPPPPPPRIRQAGTQSATRERLGDFYLYPLAARTTIANQQTKQVSFLDVAGAPGARAYEFRNGWLQTADEPRSADSVLKFSTGRAQGLGDALPAGTVRVYQKDARGRAQFVGENEIGHTPMGSDLALKTGEAFDVKVRATVTERTKLDSGRWRTAMRYELTNARPEAVTVDLVQQGLDRWWSDTRVISESQRSDRTSSDSAEWSVRVPANGSATVTAVFDTRF